MKMENVKRCRDYILRNLFLNSGLVAVVLGVFLGSMIKLFVPLSKYGHIYVSFPGEFFLYFLHVVTTPLIFTGVIKGVSSQKIGIPGKVAVRASAYVFSTAFLSVTLGLMLVLFVKPGVDAVRKENKGFFSLTDALLDVILNIVPKNFVSDSSRQHKTVKTVSHYIQRTNILGMIVWAYIIGLGIRIQPRDTLSKIFTIVNEATQIMVDCILGFLPFGLVFMVAGLIVEVNDWEMFFKLGKFIGVVVFGFIIHATLVLPLIYFLCVRRNPYAVIKGAGPALLTAFISSSSSATLPLTFKCCEKRLKIDKKIIRFLLPIWANINLNGTVLNQVVAAIFIVQLNNINLDFSRLITIVMLSAVPSIGVTRIPVRGAVTTFFILTVVGLHAKETCLLVVTQYLLDRCNTVVNVLGDCFGVALIHHVSERDLEDIKEQGQ